MKAETFETRHVKDVIDAKTRKQLFLAARKAEVEA